MQIEYDLDIASLTTFGLHARAACLARYDNVAELKSLLSDPRLPCPLKPIGEGSNLLFTTDFPGTLLISNDRQIEFAMLGGGRVRVEATAGVVMDSLIDDCCRRGLWGIENLSGIPGTVGASAVQNIGAYGVEVSEAIATVTTLDTATSDIVTFVPEELSYGYRTSRLKDGADRGRYIVLAVTYDLTTAPRPQLGYAHLRQLLPEDLSAITSPMVRDAIISMRDAKLPQPSVTGSAGSFFKNPVITAEAFSLLESSNPGVEIPHYTNSDGSIKVPAAWLIDQCGLKGVSVGGASVWHKQPLVIVNATGNATPADVVTLEHKIIAAVSSRFGITLSPEAEHLP